MAAEQPVRHIGQENEDARGVLFRISVQIALVVFAGVVALGMWRGMEPTFALIRGLIALLIITALGWGAEAIAGSARIPPMEPELEPEPERSELELGIENND